MLARGAVKSGDGRHASILDWGLMLELLVLELQVLSQINILPLQSAERVGTQRLLLHNQNIQVELFED